MTLGLSGKPRPLSLSQGQLMSKPQAHPVPLHFVMKVASAWVPGQGVGPGLLVCCCMGRGTEWDPSDSGSSQEQK